MRKKFIAGAICPSCKEQDKIVVFYNKKNNMVKECVRCGFSDELDEAKLEEGLPSVPTRVSGENRRQDAVTEKIKIVGTGENRS